MLDYSQGIAACPVPFQECQGGTAGVSALGEFPPQEHRAAPASVLGKQNRLWQPPLCVGLVPLLSSGLDPWLWQLGAKLGQGCSTSLCSHLSFHLLQGSGHSTDRLEAGRGRGDWAQSRLGRPSPCPKLLPCPGCACPWGWGSLCPPEQHPGLAQGGCEPLVPSNHQAWVTFLGGGGFLFEQGGKKKASVFSNLPIITTLWLLCWADAVLENGPAQLRDLHHEMHIFRELPGEKINRKEMQKPGR